MKKKATKRNKELPCIWYKKIICPIRTHWQLSPENMGPWCTVCKALGYPSSTTQFDPT